MTHQVRAVFTEKTITVYHAYPAGIAVPALKASTFVAPFKRTRMTWIKPSFLWMMYRSGWATKTDQERILYPSRSPEKASSGRFPMHASAILTGSASAPRRPGARNLSRAPSASSGTQTET
jgi:hypothetical protein